MNMSPAVWKLIAENRITEAIREGQFENLPGLGQPFSCEFTDTSENWWLRAKAQRESLSLLPPALELARIVETGMARIGRLNDETAVRAADRPASTPAAPLANWRTAVQRSPEM